MPSPPPRPRIYSEGYARGLYYVRPPSFHHEQAPQSPRGGPPPEYAPPRWYDHQHPREAIWQPPASGHSGRIAHRFREGETAYHFPLRRRQMHHVTEIPASREPWTVPKPKSQERKSEIGKTEKSVSASETANGKKKKDGDSLSLLAKVSSSMAPPHKRKQQQQQRNEENESEDPETTGERTISPSTVTPRGTRASGSNSPFQPGSGFRGGPIITPFSMNKSRSASANGMPKPITPTGHPANYHPFHSAHQRPPQHYSATPYMEERSPRYYGPPLQPRGAYSNGSSTTVHHFYHPGTHGPPNPLSSNHSCGESWTSPKSEQAFYSQHPAVVERNSFDSAENNVFGGPHHESEGYWQPPHPLAVAPSHGRYDGVGPFLPPRWSHEGHPPFAAYPPHHLGPPQPYTEEHLDSGRFSASRNFAPYTYVQQPSLESKTLLRKKFSWKNYPELERFLIENREEYLEHSSRNYTVAQKQYNNMLTERLLEVAEKAGYAFDQDEFNFVSIRDRIRCYYKSYVQTVRKRGLPLPGNLGSSKKAKTSNSDDGGKQDEEEPEEENSSEDAEA